MDYKSLGSKWLSLIKKKFKEYLNETSVHGLRYLLDAKNSFERTLWLIVISSCMIFSLRMVIENCNHFYEHPIMTTVDTTVVQNVLIATI